MFSRSLSRCIHVIVCGLLTLDLSTSAYTPGQRSNIQELTKKIRDGSISEAEARKQALGFKFTAKDLKVRIVEDLVFTADSKGIPDLLNPTMANKATSTAKKTTAVTVPTATITGAAPGEAITTYGKKEIEEPATVTGTIGSNTVMKVPESTKGRFEDMLTELVDKETAFVQHLTTAQDLTLEQIFREGNAIKGLIYDFSNESVGYKPNPKEKELLAQHAKLYEQYTKLASEKRDQLQGQSVVHDTAKPQPHAKSMIENVYEEGIKRAEAYKKHLETMNVDEQSKQQKKLSEREWVYIMNAVGRVSENEQTPAENALGQQISGLNGEINILEIENTTKEYKNKTSWLKLSTQRVTIPNDTTIKEYIGVIGGTIASAQHIIEDQTITNTQKSRLNSCVSELTDIKIKLEKWLEDKKQLAAAKEKTKVAIPTPTTTASPKAEVTTTTQPEAAERINRFLR